MGLAKTSQEIIQSLIASEMYAEGTAHGKKEKPVPGVPLVTISRTLGCGGTECAQLLAQRLDVRMYDRELLVEVIKAAKADKHLLASLDERIPNWMEEIISSLFSKKATSKDDFQHHLYKVIMGIGRTGGVIVGRGANLMLQQHHPFRLHLEGSPDRCVERVANRLNIKKIKAEKMVEQINAERTEFMKKLRKKFPGNTLDYDMALNTDGFTPAQVVEIVVATMQIAGFKIPEPAQAATEPTT